MTTREEIEAAASEYRHCYANPTSCDLQEWDRCAHTLATSHVKSLAERQRRIEAAAKQIEDNTITLLLGNGVDLRKHRIAIANDIRDIITRCLDGEHS